jgi:hypothetical protein
LGYERKLGGLENKMPYVVRLGGIEIAVDSVDEAAELARKLAGITLPNGYAAAASTAAGRSGGIAQFVENLKEEARTALKTILSHGGEMDLEQLIRLMQLESGLSLAGRVVTPAAKAAKKAGLRPQDVFRTEKRRHAGGRTTTHYSVPIAARDEMRKALEM